MAAAAPTKPGREAAARSAGPGGGPAWPPRAGHGISLEPTGPVPGQPGSAGGRAAAGGGGHRVRRGPVRDRPPPRAGGLAGDRPAAGVPGTGSIAYHAAGGLDGPARAGPCPRRARPGRAAGLKPGRAGATGRVRGGQLRAPLRGAATTRPGPRGGPGRAERAAARGPQIRGRGPAGVPLPVSLGRGTGGRRPGRGDRRRSQPAVAGWRHPGQGTARGPAGQRRRDQFPGRLCPAGPVADRGRPGGRPVRDAGGRRGGFRDRGVRRTRPRRLDRAGDLRASPAAAAEHRR